jgi:hypothetical protein
VSARAERELCDLIARFVSGEDRSIALVQEIEGLLIEEFLDSEIFEQLTEVLALYQPGGTAPYVGEEELASELRRAAEQVCQS